MIALVTHIATAAAKREESRRLAVFADMRGTLRSLIGELDHAETLGESGRELAMRRFEQRLVFLGHKARNVREESAEFAALENELADGAELQGAAE